MSKLSHVDGQGQASMVDVGDKAVSRRQAQAQVTVMLNPETFDMVEQNRVAKGDVLAVARLAGIQAAKRTDDLIPLCHTIGLDHVDISFVLSRDKFAIAIRSAVSCSGRTGVEMEALTACSVAALCIYDMLKAVQRDIRITDLLLLKKEGGASGVYERSSA
ncbi:MAG: cyclic pyranopterin monophosphate synthase MoaC [Candidatus Zixiibacteriota bacterium]